MPSLAPGARAAPRAGRPRRRRPPGSAPTRARRGRRDHAADRRAGRAARARLHDRRRRPRARGRRRLRAPRGGRGSARRPTGRGASSPSRCPACSSSRRRRSGSSRRDRRHGRQRADRDPHPRVADPPARGDARDRGARPRGARRRARRARRRVGGGGVRCLGPSPARRGWHDKAAGTLVLRARSVREAGVEGPGPPRPWPRPRAAARPRPGPPRARCGRFPACGSGQRRADHLDRARAGPARAAGRPSRCRPPSSPSSVITGRRGRARAKARSVAARVRLIDVPNRLVSGLPRARRARTGDRRAADRGALDRCARPRDASRDCRASARRRRRRPDGLPEPEIRPGRPRAARARARPAAPERARRPG